MSYKNLALKPETHKRLKLAATEAGLSLMEFVDRLLAEYLETHARRTSAPSPPDSQS